MWRVVFRTTFVLGLAALHLGSTPLWSQATWGPLPVPLSPGGSAGDELTAEACPTFHWAEAGEAEGYELIVYRVEGVDATRPATIEELGHEPGAPALRQLLPAGASSWTPSLDLCLEPGGRYAWTVRVTEEGFPRPQDWADVRHFVVREQSRLERVLDKVVHRLLEEGELSAEDVEQLAAWGLGRGEPRTASEPVPAEMAVLPEAPGRSSPQKVSEAGLGFGSVAFQVDGAGFSGAIQGTGPLFGVHGMAQAGSIVTHGVRGTSYSLSGTGVYGVAALTVGSNTGVFGQSPSTSGRGVYGLTTSGSGSTYGVHGVTDSTSGRGVRGWARAPSGTNYGVVGNTASGSGYNFYASGAGTDYGPFTGGHEARLADDAGEVVPGMVVSVTGRTEVRRENDTVNLSSTLPTVTLSCRPEDPAVFGVLVAESELSEDHWYQPADGERFATVNALGEGRVWVTDANGPVRAGDYLTTSHVPGHAQRQGDDIDHSYTLGKAIETVDWSAVTETVEHGGATYKKALLAVVYTSG